MKKKQIVLFFALVVYAFSSDAQIENQIIEFDSLKSTYQTYQGRIDGNYISYYKNGNKRAEGVFENNYRKGKWTVWDSTGRIRMQRDYENPFVYKRLIPEFPKDSLVALLNVPQYNLVYNNDGYINYFNLKERMVVWVKRVWRTIEKPNNMILFDNNKLFNILYKNIIDKNIEGFYHDEDFIKSFTIEEIAKIDTQKIQVIAYKIFEDCFFDNERMVMESRIIGIAPVVINKDKGDTLDLFWVYYPQIRKSLAQEKLSDRICPFKTKTFEDLFFFRGYYGEITKEENAWDRAISTYKKGDEIKKEAEIIEIRIIEAEHNLWIGLTK
jgi:hypothetical protein